MQDEIGISDDELATELGVRKPKTPLSPEEKAAKRKKGIKQRLWIYGSIIGLLYFALWYQPYEFDIVKRTPPNPNPPVDPDSKLLFSKGTKVLVVTAHPDDSEFFIGGMLAKLAKSGAELHQVICTDGDKGYYLFFTNAAQNKVTRRQEARNAARAWNGTPPTFLGYPDRWLHNKPDVVARVAEEIYAIRPDYILAFDGDYPPRASHQDHRRSGDVAKEAAEQTHIAKWLLCFSTSAPNYTVDISDWWDAQEALLAIHKSQFYGKHLEGVENMVESMAEQDGARAGYSLGEGLRCIKLK